MPGDDELAAVRVDVSDERQRSVDAAAECLGGILERYGRRGHEPVESFIVNRFQIVGLFE